MSDTEDRVWKALEDSEIRVSTHDLVGALSSEGVYLVTEEGLVKAVSDYGPPSQWASAKEWAYAVLLASSRS